MTQTTISEVMKARRLELKLSQRDVDKLCGWRAPHYAYMERGVKLHPQERVAKVCEVLGIDVEFATATTPDVERDNDSRQLDEMRYDHAD